MVNQNLLAIRTRRSAIAAERLALDAEEADLLVAERVIQRLEGIAIEPAPRTVAKRSRAGRNQADMVTTAMSADRLWWDQAAIAEAVLVNEGVLLKHSSLQPLMSKMKAAGDVVRGAEGYALASRLEQERSPAITAEDLA